MVEQNAAFDPEMFARTALLFESKRQTFAPEAVQALAGDVLRRLAANLNKNDSADDTMITAKSVDEFCDVLVQPETAPAREFIEARRAEGVTKMGVYLGYISSAARRLGERWDDDELSFLEVTIGTGHLYALMRALRAENGPLPRVPNSRRAAMFATVPGEDHGIGITVAAEVFREKDWEIDLQIGTSFDALVAHVERTGPRIIGLSISSDGRLDTLARLVVALRLALPHTIIGVAAAGGMTGSRIPKLADIDLVFESAEAAIGQLEQQIVHHV